jgi:maleylacetoacetate isomerase
MAELPTLQVLGEDGSELGRIAQSVAIMEYLEERFPTPPLLPSNPLERAMVRQRVEVVNSSIHPIQNLKVMVKLKADFGTDRARNFQWAAYWIDRGFQGLESLLADSAGTYSVGDEPTLADVALVPQVFNAHKFGVDMPKFPIIGRVSAACEELEAFAKAAPAAQPDAE